MTVCAFENELEEFLQETPEMHDAMTTYLEARNRLLEKRKNRGFWPTKGRGKGAKGKYKGKQSRSREQLMARIARSNCRKCGAVGHWKAECPLNVSDKNQSQTPAAANVAFDDCVNQDVEVYSEAEDVTETQAGFVRSSFPPVLQETCFMALEHVSASDRRKLQNRMARFMKDRCHNGDKPGDNLGFKSGNNLGKIKSSMPVSTSVCPKFVRPDRALLFRKKPHEFLMQPPMIDDKIDGASTESIMMSSAAQCPTSAILDTGASRCIIGERTLKELQSNLPSNVCSKLKSSPSKIKFRFGNEQSLTSSYRIHFPLKAVDRRTVWLAVEVVYMGRSIIQFFDVLQISQPRVNENSILPTKPFLSRVCRPTLLIGIRPNLMPSVVSLFKAVAESLIQVMTMLLQMLIQHLEMGSSTHLTEEAPMETAQQIQIMMEELQSQRALLENLNRQRPVKAGTSSAANQEMIKPVSKAKTSMGTKSHLAQSPTKTFSEEEELEIVHQVQRQVVSMMPIPTAVPFEEWGTHLVTWGKKHKGKNFETTIREDPQYFEWCQSRFLSLTPEMQDFVRYGQMRLSRLAAQREAAEIEA
ncbi:unnamed protein product [Cladocopium goreaui]|uniref:CCHC-type domain-containing protein n=1 Tax=Cladocopium goreaui TaxID=2562237 RepID=A0A9P1D376_9DINO|nr:unnamed protein product [Cladocopium goreaui]